MMCPTMPQVKNIASAGKTYFWKNCPLGKFPKSFQSVFNQFVIYRRMSIKVAGNGQGLLQGWNSLLVRPEPLLLKDIKVQVNKQKPSDVCPAQMKYNSDKMTIAPMSSQPCSKPNVACCPYLGCLNLFPEKFNLLKSC